MERLWQGKGCCSGAVCWSGRCRPPPCGWVARQRRHRSPAASSAPTPRNCGATASRATTAGSARRGSRSKASTSRTRRPSPDAWEKVIQKLRSRTMPPAQAPRPDEATYDSLATWLEGALDRAAAAHPNPARPLLHRMNRAEYRNAIRDLLALDVDVSALPADDATYGFDNIADALGTSPLLLESYVTMARKISRMAIGSPAIPPVTTTYATAGGSHAGLSSARSAARHARRPARRGVLRRRCRVRDPGAAAAHGYSARSAASRTSTSWS